MRNELTSVELESENVTELPDRSEMSLINLNVAAPINASVGANVLSMNCVTAVSYASLDDSQLVCCLASRRALSMNTFRRSPSACQAGTPSSSFQAPRSA